MHGASEATQAAQVVARSKLLRNFRSSFKGALLHSTHIVSRLQFRCLIQDGADPISPDTWTATLNTDMGTFTGLAGLAS